ncbi:MAG: hypothetical protein ACM3JF_02075 [Sphaerimonospora mesophila]
MTEFRQKLNYTRDGAALDHIVVLPQGRDIEPFENETLKPSMQWANWNKGFSGLDIPGLTYTGCRLVAGYYSYAIRGNRKMPHLSRSQSIVSEWEVHDDENIRTSRDETGCEKLTAFFPVYDGVGFWIGKRRRETGIAHYKAEEEVAIAEASAIGALGMGHKVSVPSGPDHMIYRCIWAPGKAFNGEGKLLQNATNIALTSLGLTPRELTKSSQTTGEGLLHFRLFGDAYRLDPQGKVTARTFSSSIAERLHPAWKHVNQLPNKIDPLDPETY